MHGMHLNGQMSKPATTDGDGLDSLLEGLTGSDMQTAKLIVKALRSSEVSVLRGGMHQGGGGGDGGDVEQAADGPWDARRYLRWSEQAHRDSAVVEVDVARSLWAFTRGQSDEQREARRRQLKRLLNAVVASHAAHGSSPDGAAVPDGGELLTFALLRRLVTSHLRDATRPSLEPVVQLLGLIPHLLAAADPPLARHLAGAGLQPFFALSWFITWWAHELDDLPPASRLFDFFLASHPLMPLYLGVVAMRSQRAALLTCEDMPELHSALTNLKLVSPGNAAAAAATSAAARPLRRFASSGGGASAWGRSDGGFAAGMSLEQLLREAQDLWRAKPPHTVVPLRPARGPTPRVHASPTQQQLRRRRTAESAASAGHRAHGRAEDALQAPTLSVCVAHAAQLEAATGLWLVPLEPPLEWPGAMCADEGRTGLARLLSRASSALTNGRSRSALLSGALLAGVYVAAAVAIGYATLSRGADGSSVQQ
ncbi:hypothetical protein GPECTOR_1g838 [Gonium pectorale]|uniref:Rab-GAP TBC domain-containing protein n=1 Tax=Gonium pectorale TaxID=33097 RepID=A0A150H460_GONPE|nr:hypothetical protein GPECTOR_1g838 [Gonium pectorale]|eukprot:KXZ56929.1 hypothetical protein GPECTOR_1g838 [Gonium pectorale]